MKTRPNGSIANLTGVILAGGRSSRFGTDKAFVLYRGRPFIQHTLDLMKKIFLEVVIMTNHPEKFDGFQTKILKDEIPFQGPTGGIVTALECVGDIFVVPCDMPLLSPKVILGLLAKDNGSSVVMCRREGRLEPLCAIYRTSILPVLKSRLKSGQRELHSLLEDERVIEKQIVPLEKGQCSSLLNVNTSADLPRET